MKKTILACILIISSLGLMKAQTSTSPTERNAIGIRIGWNAEASFQRFLRDMNRLEIDLGLDFDGGVNLAGLYQWVFDISSNGLNSGFNWYVGAGLGVGLWDDDFTAGILGNIGIEYNFRIPLQLSLDWRPGLYLGTGDDDVDFYYQGICLGIRYRF